MLGLPSPALIQSILKLAGDGFGPPAATCLARLNPAQAIGLEEGLSSIQTGKKADLILVRLVDNRPLVLRALVGGREVSRFSYEPEPNAAFFAGRTRKSASAKTLTKQEEAPFISLRQLTGEKISFPGENSRRAKP